MLTEAPANAPWINFVRSALGRVTGEPVPQAAGPSDADVAAAENMSDEQRTTMIRGMVAQLSGRLHADGGGNDVDGWLRLVNLIGATINAVTPLGAVAIPAQVAV